MMFTIYDGKKHIKISYTMKYDHNYNNLISHVKKQTGFKNFKLLYNNEEFDEYKYNQISSYSKWAILQIINSKMILQPL